MDNNLRWIALRAHLGISSILLKTSDCLIQWGEILCTSQSSIFSFFIARLCMVLARWLLSFSPPDPGPKEGFDYSIPFQSSERKQQTKA